MDIDQSKLDELTASMGKLSDSIGSFFERMQADRDRASERVQLEQKATAEQEALGLLGQQTRETQDTLILRDIRDAVNAINAKIKSTGT